MLGHKVPATVFEGLKNDNASSELLEKFKSELIVVYEKALEGGLAPMPALAAMLDFVSIEVGRAANASPLGSQAHQPRP